MGRAEEASAPPVGVPALAVGLRHGPLWTFSSDKTKKKQHGEKQ